MLKKITKWETEDGTVFDTQEEAEDYMFEQEKEVITHTSTELDREECTACNGTGSGQDGWDCLSCSGDGWVFVAHQQPAVDSTSTEQPEALRLAAKLVEPIDGFPEPTMLEVAAAAELIRLHARVQELEAENAHLKDAAWTAIDALEASQAQRVPLSDEQIESLLRSWPEDGIAFFDFARAIEQAHGITQEK